MQTNKDGNSVDVTTEMLDLMKANQLYGISINAINTQYAINQAARTLKVEGETTNVSGN